MKDDDMNIKLESDKIINIRKNQWQIVESPGILDLSPQLDFNPLPYNNFLPRSNNILSNNSFDFSNNTLFDPQKYSNPLTQEEVEAMIDKKIPNKEEKLSTQELSKMIKEIMESENIQKNESLSLVNKRALEIILNELSTGEIGWYCGKCRAPLKNFTNKESIEDIKKYLIDFNNNILKKCKNGHQNWFELRDDGIVFATKTTYSKIFDKKKD